MSTPETQVQTTEKPRMRAWEVAACRAFIFAVLVAGGRHVYNFQQSHKNPDSRDAVTLTRAFLAARANLDPKTKGTTPSEETVQRVANDAICILNQMGHPMGDSYEPKGPKDPAKREYKRESSAFFTYDGDKFVLQPATHGYIKDSRYADAVSTIREQRQGEDKDTVEWFTWDDPEEFMRMPLECMRDAETGECKKNMEGEDCLFVGPLAHMWTLANMEFSEAEHRQMQMVVCFRSDLHQAVAFTGIGGRGCDIEGEREGLMLPCNSHHGMGLAGDIGEDKKAYEYLAQYGIACDFVRKDDGHCSFGEKSMKGHLRKWASKWRGAKKIWRALRNK